MLTVLVKVVKSFIFKFLSKMHIRLQRTVRILRNFNSVTFKLWISIRYVEVDRSTINFSQ